MATGLISGLPAMPQQLYLDKYDVNSGLVNNEVHCIMQDSKGVMYFGTSGGLSIYDGKTFANYDYARGFIHQVISDIDELPGNEIIFLPSKNKYYTLRHQKLTMAGFAEDILIRTLLKKKNKLYVCTNKGFYLFEKEKISKLSFYPDDSLPDLQCASLWHDSLIVIGRSYKSIDVFNINTGKKIASSTFNVYVRNIFTDSKDRVWISCIDYGLLEMTSGSVKDSVIKFEKLPVEFTPYLKSEFRSIIEDRSGNLWMGTVTEGLIKYDPAKNELLQYNSTKGLASNFILSLYCDREDNIWIGTTSGVQKLVHKDLSWYSSKDGLPADIILSMLVLPQNQLVTTGYYGIAFIQSFGKKVLKWDPPLGDDDFIELVSLQNKYYAFSTLKIAELGLSDKGVFAQKWYNLPYTFRYMVPYGDNEFLLGSDKNIGVLHQNGKLEILTSENVENITCMAIDSKGLLWTGNSLDEVNSYSLSLTNGKLTAKHLYKYDGSADGERDIIFCMNKGKNGRILFGTIQSGIFILDQDTTGRYTVTAINRTNGLNDNNIHALYWYNDSTLLAGHSGGLDKISFSAGQKHFIVNNINSYYNFSGTVYSIRKDNDGKILLGTETGLYRIPSIDVEQTGSKDLPVLISSVTLINKPDSILDIENPLHLNFRDNSLTIHYSSPSFTNEKIIRYSYWLKGSGQNSWSQPSSSGSVSFSDLPAGHYYFLVKAVSYNNAVSTQTASIEIIITPPFWKTSWFAGCIIVAFTLLIYWLVRRRIKFIRHEAEMKQQIAETEMMALRAQMNPHFIFNCINSIDALIQSNDKYQATVYLNKFAKLIRNILDSSKQNIVTLSKDMETLQLYIDLEQLRNETKFVAEIKAEESLLQDDYKVPPLIIQPYVENAILHGLKNRPDNKGKLLVQVSRHNGQIEFIIEDNGVGRRASSIGKQSEKVSYGMQMSGDRVKIFNKEDNASVIVTDLEKEGKATGTRVQVFLKIQ